MKWRHHSAMPLFSATALLSMYLLAAGSYASLADDAANWITATTLFICQTGGTLIAYTLWYRIFDRAMRQCEERQFIAVIVVVLALVFGPNVFASEQAASIGTAIVLLAGYALLCVASIESGLRIGRALLEPGTAHH